MGSKRRESEDTKSRASGVRTRAASAGGAPWTVIPDAMTPPFRRVFETTTRDNFSRASKTLLIQFRESCVLAGTVRTVPEEETS